MLKRLYRSLAVIDDESPKVLEFIDRVAKPGLRVLDVGCGLGRYLRVLSARDFYATGVEANPDIVAANVKSGLRCFTPDDHPAVDGEYDVVLMSHVVEHFSPAELLQFLDGYLDRLRPGGWLIIATPLMSPYFYDDFDHVRPFHPVGLDMVFGERPAQVQYQSRNCLAVRDVWFRRSPHRITYARGVYIRSFGTRIIQIAGLVLALMFRLSFGMFGRTDGWVGLYQKTGNRSGANV